MAGKARVHELAKELGVSSKDVLAKLSELGEFVKSASSTVEAPVARRLREAFPRRAAARPRRRHRPAKTGRRAARSRRPAPQPEPARGRGAEPRRSRRRRPAQ